MKTGGKRIFDIILSTISLLMLLPLLALAAVVIKLESKGPVLYKQERVGLNEKMFDIYKLRSMRVDADKDGAITSSDDPRLTKFGKLLRKIKLDEMPQLWNILKGEMSIVGPRPEVPEYVRLYSDEQKKVFEVRPGMTDPATVLFRNEEELLAAVDDKESYYVNVLIPFKLKLALQYCENVSIVNDIKLIFLEIFALILPQSMFRKMFSKTVNFWVGGSGPEQWICCTSDRKERSGI